LEQLVERQRAELLSIVDRQLDSGLWAKESPSDLVQESMLEGVRAFSTFRGTTLAEFGGYLKAILRNNIQDVQRKYAQTQKRALHREQSALDPDDHADSVSNSPSQVALRRDEADLLRAEMARMPEPAQKLLKLRFWEHMSFEEMASALAQHPDTTRKAYYRALEALTRAVGSKKGQSR